jgi:DNA-directed RNA polymerase
MSIVTDDVQQQQAERNFHWERAAVQDGIDRYWQGVSDAQKRDQLAMSPVWRPIIALMHEQAAVGFSAARKSVESGRWREELQGIIGLVSDAKLGAITANTMVSMCARAEELFIGEDDATSRRAAPMRSVTREVGKVIVAAAGHALMGADLADQRELASERKRLAKEGEYEYDWSQDEDVALLYRLSASGKVPLHSRIITELRKSDYGSQMNATERFLHTVGEWAIGVAWGAMVLPQERKDENGEVVTEYVRPFLRVSIKNGKRRAIPAVTFTSEVAKMVDRRHVSREAGHPRFRPLLTEPKKWACDEHGRISQRGGYHSINAPMISATTAAQRTLLREASMPLVVKAMNAMNSQTLMLFDPILSMQREAMSRGMEVGKLPPFYPPDKPPRPAAADEDKDINRKWRSAARKWWESVYEIVGRQVTHAECLRLGEEIASQNDGLFWQDYVLDFRGRASVRCASLTHYGYDAVRALTVSAVDKPMTERGMRWLKIHAANCWGKDGLDKKSFNTRAKWADDNAANMERAVRMGLDDEWWQQADDPWQFWQACVGLCEPDNWGRRIFVGRDGTFNGMQHWAAITRDPVTAAMVNLCESDDATDPRAPYAEVAAAARQLLPPQLAKLVTTKVAKPQVMLSVYGVTAYGTTNNMHASLMKEHGLSDALASKVRKAIVMVVQQVMEERMGNAVAMMEYVSRSAKAVADTGVLPAWSTVLGFPVVQPYMSVHKNVNVLGKQLALVDHASPKPRVRKNGSAASPNFIHSVDGAHFMLTAADHAAADIPMIGQFDRFCSLPADVDESAAITTAAFVETHKADPMGLFVEACRQHVPDLPDPPARGNWDIERAAKATYAFS